MITGIRAKLLGAELMVKLKQIDLPGADFEQARAMARSALEPVREGKLGYAVVVGLKPNIASNVYNGAHPETLLKRCSQ